MTENVLAELCQSHANIIQRRAEDWNAEQDQATDAWKPWHRVAMFVRTIEDLVQGCLELPRMFGQMASSAVKKMAANLINDYDQVGKKVLNGFDAGHRVVSTVRDCVHIAEKHGYRVEGADQLEQAEAALRDSKRRFEEKWPWINQEMLAKSMAAHECGESRPIQDFLHGIRHSDPKAC